MEAELSEVQLEKIFWLHCRRLAFLNTPEEGSGQGVVWYFSSYSVSYGGVPFDLTLSVKYMDQELAQENYEHFLQGGLDAALDHALEKNQLCLPKRVEEKDHRKLTVEDWLCLCNLLIDEVIYITFVTNKERHLCLDWMPVVWNNSTFYHASSDGTVAGFDQLPKLSAAFNRWGNAGAVAWSAHVRGQVPLSKFLTEEHDQALAFCKAAGPGGNYEYYRQWLANKAA